jgi:TolB-like protein
MGKPPVTGLRFFVPVLAGLLLVMTVYPVPSHGEEAVRARSRIAVVGFAANNTEGGVARGVSNSVEINLFKDGSFDILEQSQMDVILRERKMQAVECRDEKCAAKLGRLLKADYVIIGSVDRLGAYTVTIKVVNVAEGKIIISESKDAREIGDLKPASEELTRKIADRIKGKSRGAFSFRYPVFVSANFLFAMPVGYLKGISERGYGASVAARIGDLLVPGLFCGIEAQFMYLEGKGRMHHAMMVPLTAQFGYAYTIWKVSIAPFVSAGGCYTMNYYYTDQFRYWKVRRSGFQPVLKAGATFDFLAAGNFYVRIGAEYNIIFEKGGDISFVTCLAGMGLRF